MYLLRGIMVESAILVALVSLLLRRFHRRQSHHVSADVTGNNPDSVTKKVPNAKEAKPALSKNVTDPVVREDRLEAKSCNVDGADFKSRLCRLFGCCCH